MKLILFLLVLIFLIVPVNAVDWHDDSRLKRVQLNVNNSSVALTDYQLMKNITYDSDMQPDFDDLLFYNESGGSVSYWIESKTDSNTADVWLKIPSISTTTGATVWMYYDNSAASSASSGNDTFIQWHGAATSDFLDTLIALPNDYIYESKSRVLSTGTGLIWGVSNEINRDAGTTDSIHIRSYATTNKNYFDCMNDGSRTYVSESPDMTTNQWYDLKITRISSTARGYVDENEIVSGISSGLPNENMGLWMREHGGTCEQEYSYLRKYTATEPTWGADGEEESYEVPPVLNGTYLYPNSTYSIGYYGSLTSELVYETGINFSDLYTFNLLSAGNMEYLSIDDTNYIPSIDKDAAHDGYMYGNFSLHGVETVNFINIKTVHNRVETNPVILGLFNVSTQKWHAVNNSSVEIVDVELTYNITGTDIAKYTTLEDNVLNLSVSLNTNGDGNYDVFVDFVEVYIDYEEAPDITLEYVYNLTLSNQNNISILQNDVDDLGNNVNNLYLFVLLCTVFLIATLRKRGDQ